MAGNQSLSRGLKILSELKNSRSPLGVRELARRLELGPAIVQRLLNTLAEEGFVQQEAGSRKYELGFRALTLGSSMADENRLLAAAAPRLTELANSQRVNAFLCVPTGKELVYILALQGSGPISINVTPGSRARFHSTAVGKALLASFDDVEARKILGSAPLEAVTDKTVTDMFHLLGELKRTRERGYALAVDENLPGVTSIGAVVRGSTGTAVGAISIAYAPSIQTEIVLDELRDEVVQVAARISTELGCEQVLAGVS